jgi:cobalt/nickel transport system permease protein
MSCFPVAFLWAIHLQDGILKFPWLAGGFIVAAILALAGSWRVRDEEIPKIALLTAAFFVATLIHVPVPMGSAHLLLNGLMGVVLGPRAALAIPIGLFLQAALFRHGGYSTLGVNSCVMTIPALLAWIIFAGFQRIPWVRRKLFRGALVAASVIIVTLSVVYSVALLATNPISRLDSLNRAVANDITLHPITLGAILLLGLLGAWWERRLENSPEFALGLLVGETAVLATVLLNCLAVLYGGEEDWHTLALINLVVHLPIAVIEGIVLGFMVGFLVRVKPELLGWTVPEKSECAAETR